MGTARTAVKARYNEKNYDMVRFSAPKTDKEVWKSQAKHEGLSLTQYIRKKVNGN